MSEQTNHHNPLKVMIVDDEAMLRSVIEEFLGMLDYEDPIIASNGQQALEALRSQPIDCVISDIRMPEMPLEELLPIVNEEFPRMVVIATSGYSDFETAVSIIKKGAHDFLGKPLNLDALEVALNWVSHRRPCLDMAAKLFGVEGSAAEHELDQSFKELERQLLRNIDPFQQQLRHAQRVASLARYFRDLFSPRDGRDLMLAALLHEMGSSYILQSLVNQPRRLDDPEVNLVRAHAQISGRLTASYLGRRDLEALIGGHLHWGDQAATQANWSREERLSVWLGMLNFVDGCLRERPDRMPYSAAQVHESLKRRLKATGLEPIEQLLKNWHFVEHAYPDA
jgi:response regulator RpfG family c-di-GMP phosphodiesterase